MSDQNILGYDKNDKPIYEVPRGVITTAAFILCSNCGAAIRSNGGPRYGSLCVPCHDAARSALENKHD
jgi:hypothetical protein